MDRDGEEMFRIKDRHDLSYALGPTHEESFSFLLKPLLKSYKDLPINVYQIQTKFRDEIRPRFGVIRSREFIMKDAYSFHIDDVSLDETYQAMRVAYRKIFDRCGLKTIPVQADSGSMGGSASEEFMVVSPIGEETLLLCNSCGYSSNSEKTPLVLKKGNVPAKLSERKEISTPGKKTIAEVSAFLGISEAETIKAIALKSDKKKILVFLRGDLELNLHKLHSLLRITDSEPMTDLEIRELGLVPGFISPISTNDKIKVLYDRSLRKDFPYVVGSSKEDFHTQGFILEKEVSGLPEFTDVALAREGDLCPNCNSPLKAEKGIEVGHIFKLGEKYTKAFGIQVLDQNGKSRVLTMGCYGIGVNRTMATVIEQCNDEKGIFWPISIAPFEVTLVSITKGEEQYSKAEEFYNVLKNEGIEIFWDDRDVGPGFKLKDSELIGFPIRVTIGKKFFENGEIGIYNRKKDREESFVFAGFENLIARVESLRQELFAELE